MPERLLSQYLRSPGGKEYRPRENGDAVGPRIPGPDVLFRSTGKERPYGPADEPRDPDERQ